MQGLAARAQLVSLEGVDISLQPGFSFALFLPRDVRSDNRSQLRTLVDWACHVVGGEVVDPDPTSAVEDPQSSAKRNTGYKERELLKAALLKAIDSKSLPFDAEIMASKCLDLYDSINTSTAIFVTGGSRSGKTACWRLLAEALSSQKEKVNATRGPGTFNRGLEQGVNARVFYPGAMTREELLGEYGPKHQVRCPNPLLVERERQ